MLPRSAEQGEFAIEVDGEGEGDDDEAFVAIDAELLHRRMGHVGKVALDRLVRVDLVRGLEVGWLGRWECVRVVSWPGPNLIRTIQLTQLLGPAHL